MKMKMNRVNKRMKAVVMGMIIAAMAFTMIPAQSFAYNANAQQYYEDTVTVDFAKARETFLACLPQGASILDAGCGSGRDLKAFADLGYRAVGLDASEELARLGRNQLGVKIITGDMASWIVDEPFDGIWCCASILHLTEEEEARFFDHLDQNLKSGGVLFISVKSGIPTGPDDKGRYMRNHTQEQLEQDLRTAGLAILRTTTTKDKLGRSGFTWLNILARKDGGE